MLMEAELHEAPHVVARQMALLASPLRELAARLRRAPPQVVVTCARGSSGHGASFGKYLIERHLGIPVAAVAPSIMTIYRQGLRLKGQLFLTISQAGRSDDLVEAASSARAFGALTAAIVNDTRSPLASACDIVLPMAAGKELSVAATKSFVASVAVLLNLTATWAYERSIQAALDRLPERLGEAAKLDWSPALSALYEAKTLATLGRGPTLAIVRQRRGGSLPSWARGEGQPIGRHTFYFPNDHLRFDASSQPLTRADCGKAGMLWNEGANVCTDSTSTVEANLQAKAPEVRGDALAALDESESNSTRSGEAPAAVHKAEIAAMESPEAVETAAPRTQPKTAKPSTPSRPKVAGAKAPSKSKLVKSGGSRGRVGSAKSSTKSSMKIASKSSVKNAAKTASRSSVKNAAKTASNSSLKSASKRSMKTAVKNHRIHARVAAAYQPGARARIAASTAASPHPLGSAPRFKKSAQAAGPANYASR
jgi:D-arabinose 5-phosphate isomerase GutQ